MLSFTSAKCLCLGLFFILTKMRRARIHSVPKKMPWWISLTFMIIFLSWGTTTNQESLVEVPYCSDDYKCTFLESYSAASSVCSCHPACRYFRDCCYNVDFYNSFVDAFSSVNKSTILDNILEYKEYYECIRDVITKETYRMVSKCPSGWTVPNNCDIDGDDQKLGTVGNLQGISSMPVVSADGVTFRNIYCAICHGLATETLSPWSLHAECENTDFFPTNSSLSLEEKVQSLIRNCERVSFLPPTNHPTAAIPCREPQNKTEIYDVECNQNSSEANSCLVVVAPLRIDSILFRNRYCAKCYYSSLMNTTLFLVERCAFIPGECAYGNVSSQCTDNTQVFVPISITFNFGGLSGELTISKGNEQIERVSLTCEQGQVFDPTSSRCIYLECPPGYNLDGTDCVQDNQSNTNAASCQKLGLKITMKANERLPYLCSTNIKLLLKCLPINSTSVIDNGVGVDFSCFTTRDKVTQISVETNISSMLTLEKLFFSTSSTEKISRNDTQICHDIKSIDILSFCQSTELFLACDLLDYSGIHWRINGNSSSKIVIANTSEMLDISEIKFRKHVKFSENLSVEESLYLYRCRPCPLVTMDASLFEPSQNDVHTLVYSANQTIHFSSEMYLLGANDDITLCNFLNSSGEIFRFLPQYSFVESVLSTAGIVLSTIALAFTLITYCVFASLRARIASILIMTLCACLIIAQVFLLFAGVAVSSPLFCNLVSGIGHLFWLTTFSTSSVLGFVLNQTFSLRNQTVRGHKPSIKNITIYLLSCFAVPLFLSGTLLILYLKYGERFGITYGNRNGCWIGGPLINLCAFGVPVAVSLALNLFFFSHVVISLCVHHRDRVGIRRSSSRSQMREFLIYVKIFVILGLTWIVGFAASFFNHEILWYIFIILTSLQGVFVFLSFTVKSKVWQLWRTKIRKRKFHVVTSNERLYKATPGTATSTF